MYPTQDNIRTVCELTDDDGFHLRPGVNLGVRIGIIRESLEGDRVVEAFTVKRYEDEGRAGFELGYVSPHLPYAADFAVRTGVKPHFDLRVNA
ncbi:unnamed protein product, partial [Pylaiella littoralis]